MADDEQKYFSLTEAERLRAQLEPVLIEAIEARRKLGDVEEELSDLAERIQRSGGLAVGYEKASKARVERNRLREEVRDGARSDSGDGLRGEGPRRGPARFSGAHRR